MGTMHYVVNSIYAVSDRFKVVKIILTFLFLLIVANSGMIPGSELNNIWMECDQNTVHFDHH